MSTTLVWRFNITRKGNIPAYITSSTSIFKIQTVTTSTKYMLIVLPIQFSLANMKKKKITPVNKKNTIACSFSAQALCCEGLYICPSVTLTPGINYDKGATSSNYLTAYVCPPHRMHPLFIFQPSFPR